MKRKVALATGASSGFGRLTAEHLVAQGYRVFGIGVTLVEPGFFKTSIKANLPESFFRRGMRKRFTLEAA